MPRRLDGRKAGKPMTRSRNIKLTIAFDGTAYHGWQIQQGKPTIQGILQEVLGKITDGPVNLIGSGRTDAGTHARALVANFHTRSSIPPSSLVRAVNSAIPSDIRVTSAQAVSPGFHARRSAKSKIYRYQICRAAILLPHWRRDHYHYPYHVDLAHIRQAAALFMGEHDFASFAAKSGTVAGSPKSTVRRISQCNLKSRGSLLWFTVEGNGFLHHMVRNMIGTLLELGRGRMSLEQFQSLFEARDRTRAGFTAPAKGLVLLRVRY
jgi:tRNA pseudouridine38-40 synthase